MKRKVILVASVAVVLAVAFAVNSTVLGGGYRLMADLLFCGSDFVCIHGSPIPEGQILTGLFAKAWF